MLRLKIFAILIIVSVSSQAYVACEDVAVKIQSAASAGHHAFRELGVKDGLIFIGVPASKCEAHSGEEMSSNIYIVIDDLIEANDLKSLWLSMLLSYEARGVNIRLHASSLGVNSKGLTVLVPYFLSQQ